MAVANGEAEADRILEALTGVPCAMSVANWLEVSIVADNRSAAHGARIDELIGVLGIEIVAVTPRQGEVARLAHQRFGRGSGSPARLNYGDCFAYALSVVKGEPLLYVGDDFVHTDVASVLR